MLNTAGSVKQQLAIQLNRSTTEGHCNTLQALQNSNPTYRLVYGTAAAAPAAVAASALHTGLCCFQCFFWHGSLQQ
jgi:hypothetical protein